MSSGTGGSLPKGDLRLKSRTVYRTRCKMSTVASHAANRSCADRHHLLSCAAMQSRSPSPATSSTAIEAVPITIEGVELRTVRLSLHEPFETSFGRIDSRLIFLVSVKGA